MANLDYNKILDLTLSVLSNETPNIDTPFDHIFQKKPELNNLVDRDKLAIIEKLITDRYIFKMPQSMEAFNNYYITLEGILFINSGGYVAQQKKECRLKTWIITKNVLLIFGTAATVGIAYLQWYQIFCGPPTIPSTFQCNDQNNIYILYKSSLMQEK